MIKEIKYSGYTATPSDYECQDGELATALGLSQENNALNPLLPPSVVVRLESGASVKLIHETSSFRHYIILASDNTLQWWDGDDVGEVTTVRMFDDVEVYQITAIGNTLVVLASDGMHYFLWKDEAYKYLGAHFPECPISFGLQGKAVLEDEFTVTIGDSPSAPSSGEEKYFDEDVVSSVTSQVLAKVNKFIADNSTNAGKFMFPFFVRYAYRLYDGSLVMHSAPVLMITTSWLSPQCFITTWALDKDYVKARVGAMVFDLDYNVWSALTKANLVDWGDIVKSVDIFISAPIYTYNQAGEVTGWMEQSKRNKGYSICRVPASSDVYSTLPSYAVYGKWWITPLIIDNYNEDDRGKEEFLLPRHSDETVKANIRECSTFYLLKSIKVEDLATSRSIIEIPTDFFQSLVAREVMTDDYQTHEQIIPQYSFVYNNRINLTNIVRRIPNFTTLYSAICYTNGCYQDEESSSSWTSLGTVGCRMFIFIKQDGRDIVVSDDNYTWISYENPLIYYFYPNTNAYKAVLLNFSTGKYYELKLEQHDHLNGVFFFGGWNPEFTETTSTTVTTDNDIPIPNKIYTSEVNNPFYFPLLGINTVGTGTILGISAATKALSEGQFGQFPLYAFTTEGVWALEVSSTGTYSAKQPVSRDVCISPDSITQLDNAVLFATQRGIMHISGSTVQCLTDSLYTEDVFSIADFPKADVLISLFNNLADENEQITLDALTLLPFGTFLAGCRIIYDYVHQRIIIYNKEVNYAYVYSLKSREWGMMRSSITDHVNSYPEALAMTSGSELVDFSSSPASSVASLVITRPFKLGMPNEFKTIDTIIQRGNFISDHVTQVLYGSNDLINWHTVWSSKDKYLRGFRGTPYKAFRLALVCRFDKGESLFGCTVQFTPRLLNKPR